MQLQPRAKLGFFPVQVNTSQYALHHSTVIVMIAVRRLMSILDINEPGGFLESLLGNF